VRFIWSRVDFLRLRQRVAEEEEAVGVIDIANFDEGKAAEPAEAAKAATADKTKQIVKFLPYYRSYRSTTPISIHSSLSRSHTARRPKNLWMDG